MNEPNRKSTCADGRCGQKSLAMIGTVLFLGIALLASRSSLLTAPADDAKEKKAASPAPNAVAAANKFLEALEAKQREKALYEYGSTKKPGWSNLPVAMVPRNGVALSDLTKEQRALAMDVIAAVLSKSGYQKMIDIMDGDQRLAEGEGQGPKGGKDKDGKEKDKDGKDKGKGGKGKGPKEMFGNEKYYLAIFGKPSETQPWMVQFGGHHLGLNVTVIGKNFVLTPTHTGAQPTLFKRGEMDVRPLGVENDTGFKLVNALDENQRKQAITGDRAQGELLLGPGRDGGKVPPPEGIKGSALTAEQQAILLELIGAWVDIVERDAAKMRIEEIKGNIGETYFAWKGPTAKGSAVYFRIQGPTVWIEYAPQGGTNHIHTVVRNPKDDYGVGLLKAKE